MAQASARQHYRLFAAFLAVTSPFWLTSGAAPGAARPDSASGAPPTRTDFAAYESEAARPLVVADAGDEGGRGPRSESESFLVPSASLSDSATRSIEHAIDEAAERCEQVGAQYRVDCLGSEFTRLAEEEVPTGNDYQPVRTELYRTWRKLREVTQENRDPGAPAARTPRGSYQAVRSDRVAAANAAATAVLREAQTRLLRSAEASERRRVHYTSIARSLGGTTRILRS